MYPTPLRADRSQAKLPGLYLSEVVADANGMSNPILVCSEPTCTFQAPTVYPNDAYVYDRAGTRTLIQVGTPTSLFSTGADGNTDLQNSELPLTVFFLAPNGRQLGAPLGAGCDAVTGFCAGDAYVSVTATGTFTVVLSAASPVALFRISSTSDGWAYASTGGANF